MQKNKRSGFTLIELLVVIAIIAVLIALLVPAVQKVRSAAANTQCLNNLKQIALATHGYHDSYKKFPYAVLDYQIGESTGSYVTGWILILPFLEQDNVAKRWNPKLPRNSTDDSDGDGHTNMTLQQSRIPTYTCPAMLPPDGTNGGSLGTAPETRAPCSYVFSTGNPTAYQVRYGSYASLACEGVILPMRNTAYSADPNQPEKGGNGPVRFTGITDGSSNTIMVGESDFMPSGVPSTSGPVWAYGYLYNWTGTSYGINKRDGTGDAGYGAFRSQHPGGANFAFADGTVRFIDQGINQTAFTALGTRAGGETVSIP